MEINFTHQGTRRGKRRQGRKGKNRGKTENASSKSPLGQKATPQKKPWPAGETAKKRKVNEEKRPKRKGLGGQTAESSKSPALIFQYRNTPNFGLHKEKKKKKTERRRRKKGKRGWLFLGGR